MFIQIFKTLYNLYSWELPQNLIVAYRDNMSSPIKFARWFLTSKTFHAKNKIRWESDKAIIILLMAFMVSLIASGIWLLYWWAWHGTAGVWAFGLALLIGYPFMVAVAILVAAFVKKVVWYVLHPKKFGYEILAIILESQVKALRRKHHIKVIAVGGSVGKTSTKLAIANLLGQSMRVLHQVGNYNDRLTVPLIFFEQSKPAIYNIFSWLRVIGDNTARIAQPYLYDVVVVELGTDGPGQMERFKYLKPDIGVLTAISPEHMEYFKTIDLVAKEELELFNYCKRVLVNGDDIAGKYLLNRTFEEYSLVTNVAHNYYAKPTSKGLEGQRLHVEFPSGKLDANIKYIGKQGAKFAVAAAAVADMLGVSHDNISAGLERLHAFSGRMQILAGKKDSILIDDTYNSSPIAAKAALDVLYSHKRPQRIAILGSMNELGAYAEEAHKEVGEYCDPKKLDFVVTIGDQAEKWLAPVAKKQGNNIHSFKSPYQAGRFVEQQLKKGAIVLGKGSQNGVFTEEALKALLAYPADSELLVRQSPAWLRCKAKQFKS